jgi:phosphopantothenoylcysteine decarboxylase/phosphopantothenate--cysteine ligase
MRRCLISAGPTREYLDPVRFLSNPSTGKMGYALAVAAREQGWDVVLVSGPVALSAPDGVHLISVQSAMEMERELKQQFGEADLLIMSAAVGDFRPRQIASQKIKRGGVLTLELEPIPDILAGLAAVRRVGQTLVGFAAETENLEQYARAKLIAKNVDWIVANRVDIPGQGFASDQNAVEVFSRTDSRYTFGPAPKLEIARQLMKLWSGVQV